METIILEPMSFVQELEQTEWSTPRLIEKVRCIQEKIDRIGNVQILPERQYIFRALRESSPKHINVVILGQDPYPTPGHACGLCFSYQGNGSLPPSLINIYQELRNEGFTPPSNGDLSKWAEMGVLLLNTSLTVEARKRNSHEDIWKGFTKLVIKQIPGNFVALLWGRFAQKYSNLVRKVGGIPLTAPHPSPMSAASGFFGCGHFQKCNQLLEKMGKRPIQW